MYFYISSDDSDLTYPGNNSRDFLSELPKEYMLGAGWSCALVECDFDSEPDEELFISTDIIQNSSVHGKLIPILNIVSKSGKIDQPYYIELCRSVISRVRIQLLTKKGKPLQGDKPSHCRIVLHLKKK